MCNLEYILATAHHSTIHTLIHRLQITLSKVLDIDLSLLLRCLTLAEAILHADPLQLASEIIGRLRQLKGKLLLQTAFCRLLGKLLSQTLPQIDAFSDVFKLQ